MRAWWLMETTRPFVETKATWRNLWDAFGIQNIWQRFEDSKRMHFTDPYQGFGKWWIKGPGVSEFRGHHENGDNLQPDNFSPWKIAWNSSLEYQIYLFKIDVTGYCCHLTLEAMVFLSPLCDHPTTPAVICWRWFLLSSFMGLINAIFTNWSNVLFGTFSNSYGRIWPYLKKFGVSKKLPLEPVIFP